MSTHTRTTAIRAILIAGSAATEAIVSTRVYFAPWPPGATLPLVTMMQINAGFSRTFGQGIHGPLERWSFTAWATTREAVNDLIEAIMADLDGQAGNDGGGGATLAAVVEIEPQVWLHDSETKLDHQAVDMTIGWSD